MKKKNYLLYLIIKFSPLLLIILLLSAIDSATYTIIPLFTKYVFIILNKEEVVVNLPKFLIDFFNSGQTAFLSIMYAVISLFIFQFLRGILKFITGVYRQFFGETVARDIRVDMFTHIQNLSYSYHNNADHGDLIQKSTSDNDIIRNFLANQLGELVSTFAILFCAVYQMSKINAKLTLVSVIIIPIFFLSSIIYFRFIKKRFEIVEESESKLMTIMQENINGVRVVKAFGNEQYENERFDQQNQDYAKKSLSLQKISALFWGTGDGIALFQYLLVTIVAVNIAMNDATIKLSDITTVLVLVGSVIWPVRGLGRIIGDFGKSKVASDRIGKILSISTEYLNDALDCPEINGDIKFDHVSFKFDDTNQHLINDLSFEIKKGQTVAIMGKTGSGKSTIAKILTRLYDYDEGSILIDNFELKNINKKYLRNQIGLVLQEPFLFTRSVYDNIAITNKKMDKNIVLDAARTSQIDKDINTFEKGYDTLVGEKGTTLSGGQKQRIAIARILVNPHPIIIFDDSLSAVDSETDLMIRKALEEKTSTTTMIIITHRITTAMQADKIIFLDNGRIVQEGTHQELKDQPGIYKNIWDIQGKAEEEFNKILELEGR